jgi:hypothetical protein
MTSILFKCVDVPDILAISAADFNPALACIPTVASIPAVACIIALTCILVLPDVNSVPDVLTVVALPALLLSKILCILAVAGVAPLLESLLLLASFLQCWSPCSSAGVLSLLTSLLLLAPPASL